MGTLSSKESSFSAYRTGMTETESFRSGCCFLRAANPSDSPPRAVRPGRANPGTCQTNRFQAPKSNGNLAATKGNWRYTIGVDTDIYIYRYIHMYICECMCIPLRGPYSLIKDYTTGCLKDRGRAPRSMGPGRMGEGSEGAERRVRDVEPT